MHLPLYPFGAEQPVRLDSSTAPTSGRSPRGPREVCLFVAVRCHRPCGFSRKLIYEKIRFVSPTSCTYTHGVCTLELRKTPHRYTNVNQQEWRGGRKSIKGRRGKQERARRKERRRLCLGQIRQGGDVHISFLVCPELSPLQGKGRDTLHL